MSGVELGVVVGAIAGIGWVNWYFFLAAGGRGKDREG